MMRKSPIKLAFLAIFLTLVLFYLPGAEGESDTLNKYPIPTIGDYWNFKISNYQTMIDSNADAWEFNGTSNESATDALYEITAKIETQNGIYWERTVTWGMNYDAYDLIDGNRTDYHVEFSFSGKQYIENGTWLINWTEDDVRTHISWVIDGDDIELNYNISETITYTPNLQDIKMNVKAGDSWSSTVKEKSTGLELFQLDWSDSITYINEESENTTNYEVISAGNVTVPAGTFYSHKIKEQELNDDEYEILFFANDFGPVKIELYEKSKLSMILELKDYKVDKFGYEPKPKNRTECPECDICEECEDKNSPGFSITLGIIAIVLVTMGRKNGEKQ